MGKNSMAPSLRLALAATFLAAAAQAQEPPEFSWGVAATSNYIFRGETQSDDQPAIQGYVEGAVGVFYAGAWGSTVDLDDDSFELDLYAGVRPAFGDISFDIGYVRYFYDESGDCCGEIVLGATGPLGDTAEVGAAFYWDPDAETTWLEATAGVAAPFDLFVDGVAGADFGSLGLDGDKAYGNIGVSRTFAEIATLDLRLHDSNVDPARLVLTASLDF